MGAALRRGFGRLFATTWQRSLSSPDAKACQGKAWKPAEKITTLPRDVLGIVYRTRLLFCASSQKHRPSPAFKTVRAKNRACATRNLTQDPTSCHRTSQLEEPAKNELSELTFDRQPAAKNAARALARVTRAPSGDAPPPPPPRRSLNRRLSNNRPKTRSARLLIQTSSTSRAASRRTRC